MTIQPNLDLALYAVHFAFWGTFGVTRMILNARDRGAAVAPDEPVAREERAAPFSRVLLAFHSLAFGLMYFGIGSTVFTRSVPEWFPGQRIAGTCVIAVGAALAAWSLVYFRSWRFRAKLDAGHQLATGGPFRYLRHPIYMGLNLLALGSSLWVPSYVMGVALVLMVVGSDLRARAEEKLLLEAFGPAYRDYCTRTRRFVPGVY